MTNSELIGYAAAFGTTFSFVPQVYKILRTRNTEGISITMYSIFVIGVFLWLIYGLITHAWPVAVANGLTLILSGAVLVLKLISRHKL